jgi:serine/threonine protein kinase
MAPEIVIKQEYSGPPADIWASCVLLFALLCGYFPYKGATDAELYERICSCESYPPETLSPEAKDFLNGIFQYDPDDRPSAEEIFYEQWMMLPINEKYSTGQSTGVGASKSGISSQSSEDTYTRNYKPKLFATQTMKKQDSGMDAKEKIKSKLFVLSDSPRNQKAKDDKDSKKLKIPKSIISLPKNSSDGDSFKVKDNKEAIRKLGKSKADRYDEKHYHLHLYHHLYTKDRRSKAKETESAKQAAGIGPKSRAHTDSRDGDTDTTTEIAAVSGINELKRNIQKNQYFKDSAEILPKKRAGTEDHREKRRQKETNKKSKHIKYENSKESTGQES